MLLHTVLVMIRFTLKRRIRFIAKFQCSRTRNLFLLPTLEHQVLLLLIVTCRVVVGMILRFKGMHLDDLAFEVHVDVDWDFQ